MYSDPWKPSPPSYQSTSVKEESEKYITSLENKLNRLKARDRRELKAKDIVTGLSEAKSRQMLSLSQGTEPYSTTFTGDEGPIDNNSVGAVIQRRLQPEKQALTTEELRELVEYDELDQARAELRPDDEIEPNDQREETIEQMPGAR